MSFNISSKLPDAWNTVNNCGNGACIGIHSNCVIYKSSDKLSIYLCISLCRYLVVIYKWSTEVLIYKIYYMYNHIDWIFVETCLLYVVEHLSLHSSFTDIGSGYIRRSIYDPIYHRVALNYITLLCLLNETYTNAC